MDEISTIRAAFRHGPEADAAMLARAHARLAAEQSLLRLDIAGLFEPPSPDAPNAWTVYFEVADAQASVAKATELGAQVMQEPMEIPDVGTFAVLTDPAGALFAVIRSEQPAG